MNTQGRAGMEVPRQFATHFFLSAPSASHGRARLLGQGGTMTKRLVALVVASVLGLVTGHTSHASLTDGLVAY